jgi:surfeit locus 1 family protein
LILPGLFGLLGTAVLLALGVWQLDRADQKAALIADMEARLVGAPGPLPATLASDADNYRPVRVEGAFEPSRTFVLSAVKGQGAGFRVIAAFRTDAGRRILVDRGFLPEAQRAGLPATGAAPHMLIGNLQWPDDADSFTPAYDSERDLFFSRNVAPLAEHLETEPIMLVLRASNPPHPVIQPMPVDGVSIPDNHMGYAVQWFLMALAWAGMTVFFLWRIRAQRD